MDGPAIAQKHPFRRERTEVDIRDVSATVARELCDFYDGF